MPLERRLSASCGDLQRHGDCRQLVKDCDQSFTFNRIAATLNCDMCVNYESRLQQYQETERRLRQQLNTLQTLNEQYKFELSAERLQRKDLDSTLRSLQESVERQLQDTGDLFKCVEVRIAEAQELFRKELTAMRSLVDNVLSDRKNLVETLNNLQSKYDDLLGKHRRKAERLQNEVINLPQTIEELHLLCLQLREELIESRMTEEHLEESLRSELLSVKSQFESDLRSKSRTESELTEDVNNLRTSLAVVQSQLSDQQAILKVKSNIEKDLERCLSKVVSMEEALKTAEMDKQRLESALLESRTRANSLQKELDNCVQVQKDFVHLSQSLQVQLENIRQSEHEVRWEDEGDVLMCRGCKQIFGKQRSKLHCRHCGRVFCEGCLFRSVPSGSQKKLAKVCEVCHTLLNRNSAPYFSVNVPQSDGF